MSSAPNPVAGLRFPAFISDNMVLQQGVPLPLWGWVTPGSAVTLKFAGQTKSVVADKQGKWLVQLDPVPASAEGRELTVHSARDSQTVTLHNVVVGEVWLASGQSNMEWAVNVSLNAEQESAAANYPQIRQFTVGKTPSGEPQANVLGTWSICNPGSVGSFSAVAYFFARKLHQELGVPVGIINSSWGGTLVEPWTSQEAMQADPDAKPILDVYLKSLKNFPRAQAEYLALRDAWERQYLPQDPGNGGYAKGWADPALDASDWGTMKQPGTWQNAGLKFNGVVWFRKVVDIPAAWAGRDLLLSLGSCDDFDTSYFNNTQVGAIGKENPNAWATPREYPVPGSLVRAGRNFVTVRIYDHMGGGGFTGQPVQMHLRVRDGSVPGRVALDGDWQYRVEHNFGLVQAPAAPPQPLGPDNANAPTALFNGMIAPLIPFKIRGAIWYQGESNCGNAWLYRRLFPLMINDWRRRWAPGESAAAAAQAFTFLFVQLANYMESKPEPGESQWAELRESQLVTLSLPNTGMAVAIDIGDAADIHPRNKQDVGLRLALAALAQTYRRKELAFSGPIFASQKNEGSKIRLSFRHAAGGLVARGGKLQGFAIAGADRKFVWAEARIDGDTVLVSAPAVPQPVAVRYAWADNPVCNLYNAAGLPASPFRTDDWPLTTQPRG